VTRLTAQNETHVDKIANLEYRLVAYQQMLIEKYSAMEQAIARADAMSKQLEAFLKGKND
jgi:flagellar capping protein FliD